LVFWNCSQQCSAWWIYFSLLASLFYILPQSKIQQWNLRCLSSNHPILQAYGATAASMFCSVYHIGSLSWTTLPLRFALSTKTDSKTRLHGSTPCTTVLGCSMFSFRS
jgi:hypothetical protein